MGSYTDREELEKLTNNINRETVITVLKIYFLVMMVMVIVSGIILFKYIL